MKADLTGGLGGHAQARQSLRATQIRAYIKKNRKKACRGDLR